MEELRLYRGITVSESEAEMIIQEIKTNGIYQNDKQQWGGFIWKNLKSKISTLYYKEDLTRKDTEPASQWIERKNGGHLEYTEGELSICFADKLGAVYYATKHNVTKEHTVPLLITVDIAIDNLAIDGRDFLYTVFGYMDTNNLKKTKRQTKILKLLYGEKMEYYIEKIIKHPKSEKYAICDLAIIDNEIIIGHSKNQLIIRGRNNTTFKSAFWGKVPIPNNQVINVERLTNISTKFIPQITLDEILER